MVDGSQEVTTDTKQIQYDAVHRQEPLCVRSGGELESAEFSDTTVPRGRADHSLARDSSSP